MLRSTVTRAVSYRAYGTAPDIAALLARVEELTANVGNIEQKARFTKAHRKPVAAQKQASTDSTSTRKPRLPTVGSQASEPVKATDNLSDVVKAAPARTFKNQLRAKSGPVRTNKVRQSASTSTNNARPQMPRQRKQRREGRSNNSSSSKPAAQKTLTPKANPNIPLLNTTYTPEVPTLDTLLSQAPITSQSASSRILKAYKELKANSDADVSGVLTGKFQETSESAVVSKLKTDALKFNASVVVSSLNKNTSLDYETKMKLLLPLSGLASVKQLTA